MKLIRRFPASPTGELNEAELSLYEEDNGNLTVSLTDGRVGLGIELTKQQVLQMATDIRWFHARPNHRIGDTPPAVSPEQLATRIVPDNSRRQWKGYDPLCTLMTPHEPHDSCPGQL